jgi:hypothetical protein
VALRSITLPRRRTRYGNQLAGPGLRITEDTSVGTWDQRIAMMMRDGGAGVTSRAPARWGKV